jgi:tRNA (cmo5U34)-methyltransferase
MSDFDWKPDDYLERVRAAIPRYDELQEQAIAAIPFVPERVLELGMGTGETTRRLIEAYPDSWVIGLDSSPDMVFRARENYDDVQLARIEDPLPDGPWDLVIGVLSIHHLTSDLKKNLFRQVRERARSFVIGDIVKADTEITPIDPDYDFPETPGDLAAWTGGAVTWQADDLAVVQAVY